MDINSATLSALPWLPAAFLGVGLAASSGLRTFLPLLLLSGAARWHLAGVSLTGSFAWLGSDMAFLALGLAALVELAGDKIPVIDHALDVAGTFSRPAAGALAAAAVWNTHDPATAALIGLILGAPIAFGLHSAKAGTRGASTATTMGVANPVLSVVEDIAALFLGVMSLLAPVLVPFLLLFAGLLLWKVYKAARRLVGRTATS